jgi:hypothetical protein
VTPERQVTWVEEGACGEVRPTPSRTVREKFGNGTCSCATGSNGQLRAGTRRDVELQVAQVIVEDVGRDVRKGLNLGLQARDVTDEVAHRHG